MKSIKNLQIYKFNDEEYIKKKDLKSLFALWLIRLNDHKIYQREKTHIKLDDFSCRFGQEVPIIDFIEIHCKFKNDK